MDTIQFLLREIKKCNRSLDFARSKPNSPQSQIDDLKSKIFALNECVKAVEIYKKKKNDEI